MTLFSLRHDVFDLCFAGGWCLSFLASNPIRHVCMCVRACVRACVHGVRMTRCACVVNVWRGVRVCTCVRVSAMDKKCRLNIVLYCIQSILGDYFKIIMITRMQYTQILRWQNYTQFAKHCNVLWNCLDACVMNYSYYNYIGAVRKIMYIYI